MENITKDNLKHQNVYTRLYPSRIWFKLLPTSSQCAALYTTEYPLINHSCAQHNEPRKCHWNKSVGNTKIHWKFSIIWPNF